MHGLVRAVCRGASGESRHGKISAIEVATVRGERRQACALWVPKLRQLMRPAHIRGWGRQSVAP